LGVDLVVIVGEENGPLGLMSGADGSEVEDAIEVDNEAIMEEDDDVSAATDEGFAV